MSRSRTSPAPLALKAFQSSSSAGSTGRGSRAGRPPFGDAGGRAEAAAGVPELVEGSATDEVERAEVEVVAPLLAGTASSASGPGVRAFIADSQSLGGHMRIQLRGCKRSVTE